MEKEDRIRQKEQWKQLSPSEKWQYFIDYYLWVTIGVTTGIVILIFLIVHFATKTSFVMGVMAVNTESTSKPPVRIILRISCGNTV